MIRVVGNLRRSVGEIMETKFKVGDEVYSPGERSYVGKVVDVEVNGQLPYPPKDNIVYHVKWPSNNVYQYDEDDIHLVDPEADKLLKENLKLKMEAVISSFDSAFELWQEAQDMCDEAGQSIYEMKEHQELAGLFRKFESHVESGGWSSSSLYC